MSQAGPIALENQPGIVELLEGNTGGPVGPNASNVVFIVGSGSISVTGNPGTNTLTIQDTGITGWNKISTSQMLADNMGYFCTGGGALLLALPATSNVGDQISVALIGSTSWEITQGAGQQITIGNKSTTAGVGGSLTSTAQGDTITMVCYVTNLSWMVISSMGNPIVV